MKELILYIHGKGGCAGESEHYKPLFPECEVIGLDYQTFTPWESGEEIREAVTKLNDEYDSIDLIANSIGAFFSMNAGIDEMIHRAYFISPVVDMEQLILNMMSWANVTEKELEEKGVIPTSFGEDLSWEYLCYVREHPVCWTVPTRILFGSRDNLTSYETIAAFAKAHGAELTVMDGGEHWFHTDEQMRFLDNWIMKGRSISDMNEYLAYCGLNCEACEARLATVNNDDALRRRVAREWSELNGVEITAEMINCSGCRIPGVKTPYCDSLCPIRQCAMGKQMETCSGCREMERCEKLGAITEHNADALKRLKTGI